MHLLHQHLHTIIIAVHRHRSYCLFLSLLFTAMVFIFPDFVHLLYFCWHQQGGKHSVQFFSLSLSLSLSIMHEIFSVNFNCITSTYCISFFILLLFWQSSFKITEYSKCSCCVTFLFLLLEGSLRRESGREFGANTWKSESSISSFTAWCWKGSQIGTEAESSFKVRIPQFLLI